MQTFLPYSDFTKTAQCLDYRRLGKQRVEAKQIVLTIRNNANAWHNHPAVLQWKGKGYLYWLAQYGVCICLEWIRRGYRDSLLPFFEIEMQN